MPNVGPRWFEREKTSQINLANPCLQRQSEDPGPAGSPMRSLAELSSVQSRVGGCRGVETRARHVDQSFCCPHRLGQKIALPEGISVDLEEFVP